MSDGVQFDRRHAGRRAQPPEPVGIDLGPEWIAHVVHDYETGFAPRGSRRESVGRLFGLEALE